MLIYIILTIIVLLVIGYLYYKVKFQFWSRQPVFHFHNIWYWYDPPGIIQKDKFDQGLNGDLIKYKEIKSESDSQKYLVREFFLPFKRLDLTYGWRALENSKRAHYLDVIDDKTIVVSGEGEFIFFDTKNFNSKSLNQTRIKSNLDELISKENQYLKLPTEKVSIPKYFTAPYSFRISMTTRIRPENIPENERGIMTLCMILNLERLKFCDKFK